jgi:hypothetical protein
VLFRSRPQATSLSEYVIQDIKRPHCAVWTDVCKRFIKFAQGNFLKKTSPQGLSLNGRHICRLIIKTWIAHLQKGRLRPDPGSDESAEETTIDLMDL